MPLCKLLTTPPYTHYKRKSLPNLGYLRNYQQYLPTWPPTLPLHRRHRAISSLHPTQPNHRRVHLLLSHLQTGTQTANQTPKLQLYNRRKIHIPPGRSRHPDGSHPSVRTCPHGYSLFTQGLSPTTRLNAHTVFRRRHSHLPHQRPPAIPYNLKLTTPNETQDAIYNPDTHSFSPTIQPYANRPSPPTFSPLLQQTGRKSLSRISFPRLPNRYKALGHPQPPHSKVPPRPTMFRPRLPIHHNKPHNGSLLPKNKTIQPTSTPSNYKVSVPPHAPTIKQLTPSLRNPSG